MAAAVTLLVALTAVSSQAPRASLENLVESLRWSEKSAESLTVGFWDWTFRTIMADQSDKAMDWVEKGFEMHAPLMTYITTPARYFDRVFGDPTFRAFVRK